MTSASVSARDRDGGIARSAIALLVEDRDLAAGVPDADRDLAERVVVVPGFTVAPGECELERLAVQPHLGLLVLEGFVTINIALDDRIGSLLAGPGDVLQAMTGDPGTVPSRLSYAVSERARLALLDRRFIAAVRRWPELLIALHDRLHAQEHRLMVHSAIAKLRRVEDRVLAVLWHLGERWGRVTTDGVLVPLVLTHETIGRLAGAERPTVSLALAELGERGEVLRRDDGAFVLASESFRRLDPGTAVLNARALRIRRPHETEPEPVPSDRPSPAPRPGARVDVDGLHSRLAALREGLPDRVRDVEQILDASRHAAARSRAIRARVAGERRDRLIREG